MANQRDIDRRNAAKRRREIEHHRLRTENKKLRAQLDALHSKLLAGRGAGDFLEGINAPPLSEPIGPFWLGRKLEVQVDHNHRKAGDVVEVGYIDVTSGHGEVSMDSIIVRAADDMSLIYDTGDWCNGLTEKSLGGPNGGPTPDDENAK